MEESPPLIFVVGAGASNKDFGAGVGGGLPLGSELASRIRDSLNREFGGDQPPLNGPIYEALRRIPAFAPAAYKAAADRIRRSIHSKDSIDDLLHEWRDHQEMIDVGKVAIANEILLGEAQTALGRPQGEDAFLSVIGNLQQSWLGLILRNLPPNRDHRNLLQMLRRSVGFVIFNYDRCVERMLVGELVCNTTAGFKQAHAYVQQMAIIHPYGHLGIDSGEPPPLGLDGRPLYEISLGIRTYTEESKDTESLNKLKSMLANAKRVVFLGFGYHPIGIELLLAHGLNPDQDILGACLNPAPERIQIVREKLFRNNEPKLNSQFFSMPANAFVLSNLDRILRRPF